MAGTYGDMQTRIADELARSDLTGQIRLAIQSAIRHYERRRFPWNEAIGTFSTVAGQETYGAAALADLATLAKIDAVRLTLSGGSFALLRPATLGEILAWNSSAAVTGEPARWCFHARQLRLHPIPAAVRTVTVAYVDKLASLSASGDSNAWVDDAGGEELIRVRAKIDLLENVVREGEGFVEARALRAREAEILRELSAETAALAGSGRVVAEYL